MVVKEKRNTIIVILTLLLALSTISLAAPLVRLAESSAPVTGSGRTIFTVIIALGISNGIYLGQVVRNKYRKKEVPKNMQTAEEAIQIPFEKWTKREVGVALLGGVFLASHFWLWFQSLSYTKISISTAVVVMSPIWLILIDWIIWRNKQKISTLLGVAIACMGTVLLAIFTEIESGETQMSNTAESSLQLLGIFLALLAGIFSAVYFLIGRQVLRTRRLWEYTTVVNASASLTLLLLSLLYDGLAWITDITLVEIVLFVGLALGPSILGHSSLNYSLKKVSAAAVVLVPIGEPILSGIYAGLLFNEWPSTLEAIAMSVMLSGVSIGILTEAQNSQSQKTNSTPQASRLSDLDRNKG